ncbi:MAG TPA: hypothetical protein PLJ69_09735 [Methanothrix sp.]|nr:hypothetical protein [Methanothrix sp.]HQA63207.1 hypothetical protein [Methanothrix sp.]
MTDLVTGGRRALVVLRPGDLYTRENLIIDGRGSRERGAYA